jgi:hypothetical protein
MAFMVGDRAVFGGSPVEIISFDRHPGARVVRSVRVKYLDRVGEDTVALEELSVS